ncbi:MAG TPA: class I SAM-dependent methyltransferase [Acidimicrobiales bacterium]|nr:class I SAM-dependent methyltransferase [Acidimicrobiales bacterium]
MLSRYHASINPEEENNSHVAMLRMVGFNKRVLEAGCASGHVSERLSAQGCSVVGIEIESGIVEPAMQWLERVVIGNIEEDSLWEELEGETFDAILFGDVLEHLKDPLKTLRESAKHLAPSGTVVISAPNIAHADVKISLINGDFAYREDGLLDRTHIHFFTKESLLELVRDAGMAVVEISRVTVPVFETELGVSRGDVDAATLESILRDRESETYQFVVKVTRDNAEHSIEDLSYKLVELTDLLLDETKRAISLKADNDALTAHVTELTAQRDEHLRDLTRLREQREAIKRVLPSPILRLVKGKFGITGRD